MRKLAVSAAALLAAMLMGVSSPAMADHDEPHPNSCSGDVPTLYYDGGTDGGHLFVCGNNGFAGIEGDSDGNVYVLADGAEGNPAVGGGYVVVQVGGSGTGVGCSDSGDWNKGQGTTCP